jgi:hypothetical protein
MSESSTPKAASHFQNAFDNGLVPPGREVPISNP